MNFSVIVILLSLTIAATVTNGQHQPAPPPPQKHYKVLQPQFSLQSQGGGQIPKNWNVGFTAGLGTKVWESRDRQRSLTVGATYSQEFGRAGGNAFKSSPHIGAGLTFRYGKKK